MSDPQHNWAGNIVYRAGAVEVPRTLTDLQALVRQARKVRALGSRHSFSTIADTDATLISLAHFDRVLGLDAAARTVTVEGGITYGQLSPFLDAQGFALHNLASLPRISVAGAASTATHGSGNRNGNLATAIAGLEIVTADGDIVALVRGDADFAGAVVGLGALGIVTKIVLDIEPRFSLRQNLYLDLPFETLVDNFDAIMSSAYSVSLFTRWQGARVDQVWLKRDADTSAPADLFGARPADRPYHPVASIDPTPCTEQMGVAGPWHERLPHFRMNFTPSSGAELQTEYFVPYENAAAALIALRDIQHRFASPLLISEIRTIAADDLWMSPCFHQACVAFHFSWQLDWPAVRAVLPAIEAALAPFGVRPHWGKLFTMHAAEIQSHYERLGDFRDLLGRFDPEGKFRNDFVEDYVF